MSFKKRSQSVNKLAHITHKSAYVNQSNNISHVHQRKELSVDAIPEELASAYTNNPQQYISRLENIILNKAKEIKKLEYMNKHLSDSMKKRDIVSSEYFDESNKLREQLKQKDSVIANLKSQIKDLKSQQYTSSSDPISRIFQKQFQEKQRKTPITPYMSNSNTSRDTIAIPVQTRGQTPNAPIRQAVKQTPLEIRPKTSNLLVQSTGTGTEPGSARGDRRRNLIEQAAMRRASSQTKSDERKEELNRIRFKQMKQDYAKMDKSRQDMKTLTQKAVVVTETQGRRDFQSLLLGHAGRLSILQMKIDPLEQLMKDFRIQTLESILIDDEHFVSTLIGYDGNEKAEVCDIIRSLINDFRNFVQVIVQMRKLQRASSAIGVSLILEDALEKIIQEACEILKCDRATVFILDNNTNQLWSKVAKGTNTTIRIPKNQGIAGSVVTSGQCVRIDDAYSDHRFNKNFDVKTQYKTNTILAVPIRDFGGKIIGVLQAINKYHDEYFSADDEGIAEMLAQQAGVLLKNSLALGQNVSYHYKLLKLQSIANQMFSAPRLSILLEKSESGLKEIMYSEKAIIYLVDAESETYFNFDNKDKKKIYKFGKGIAGICAQKGQLMDVYEPCNHPHYDKEVDLDTQLPLMCLPLYGFDRKDQMVGVLQVLNLKQMAHLIATKSEIFDVEVFQMFCTQVSICLEKFLKLKGLIREQTKHKLVITYLQQKDKGKKSNLKAKAQEIRRSSLQIKNRGQDGNNSDSGGEEDDRQLLFPKGRLNNKSIFASMNKSEAQSDYDSQSQSADLQSDR